MRQYGQLS